MIELLPKLVWHYDQPFADPSALPSYYVARETRKFVTVALNGDGGDENFAGYLRYQADRIFHAFAVLPLSLRSAFSRWIEKAPLIPKKELYLQKNPVGWKRSGLNSRGVQFQNFLLF